MSNQLILLKETHRDNRSQPYGDFLCFCGNIFNTRLSNVKDGHTKSCGCIKASVKNLSGTRIYNIWCGIKTRCLNPQDSTYCWYGAKGVSISSEWANDFLAFYNWAISNGYKETLSIDRKNPDGNYEPSNCRWVDTKIQARNKRLDPKSTSGYTGVSKDGRQWRAYIHMNNKYVHIGCASTALECAIMRNEYIIKNNTHHRLNDIKDKNVT